ncbi:CU044_5270 family protein [Herbidospora daliensis]|uniref:CU044_5270 family protein n=1 Tax=Herbidospora daliensis TaxID=295585 RepID=UPI000785B2DA|nr:CU044_5270 family protein [Herbidospora daliensis]
MIDDLVRSLRPDDVTEESHRARRADDLARAFAERPARKRPPTRLLAASGLLAAAAAAFVVFAPSTTVVTRPDPVPVGTPVLTARSVLLAGAETLERTRPEKGTYWHEKIRTFTSPLDGVTVASTAETWYDGRDGRIGATTDVRTTFTGDRAEKTWRAEGRPGLPEATKDQSFTGLVLAWGIGTKQVRQADLKKLPADRAALQKWLDDARPRGEDAGAFAFAAARHILTSPAPNATRATLLRILADQGGLHLDDDATDPVGRPGLAITDATGDHTLVVDPATATLLAYVYDGPDERPVDTPPGTTMIPIRQGTAYAYLESGWSDLPG